MCLNVDRGNNKALVREAKRAGWCKRRVMDGHHSSDSFPGHLVRSEKKGGSIFTAGARLGSGCLGQDWQMLPRENHFLPFLIAQLICAVKVF